MLLSTESYGKSWERDGLFFKPPKELALGVVARDTSCSSLGSSVRDEPEKLKCREMKCKKDGGM